MKRNISIKYWWKCAGFKKVPKKFEEELHERAMEHIYFMMVDGYTSGELNEHIYIDLPGCETPNNGYECHGWFEIKGVR